MNNTQRIALAVGLVAYAVLPQFLKSYGVYLMTLLCIYLMAVFGLIADSSSAAVSTSTILTPQLRIA